MNIFNFLKSGLLLVAFLALSINVTAHQELTPAELVEYHQNLERRTEALNRCLQSPEMREHNARMTVHRDETLKQIRQARGLDTEGLAKRDRDAAEKWAAINHEQAFRHSNDPQDMFNFDWDKAPVYNSSGCALTPHSIYGPFWKGIQPKRADIRAGMIGIYMRLAMQVIDVSTCKPLSNAAVDVWHANAKGQYSNKAGGFLRGWQPTSKYGTVEYDTNFPGHYSYRASHIHILVRAPAQTRVVHVGQIYFDQWIRDQVEITNIYNTNKNQLTSNLEDGFILDSATDSFDPFVRWSKLGYSPYDGILAWITLGVDPTDEGVEQPPSANQKRDDGIDWHLE